MKLARTPLKNNGSSMVANLLTVLLPSTLDKIRNWYLLQLRLIRNEKPEWPRRKDVDGNAQTRISITISSLGGVLRTLLS